MRNFGSLLAAYLIAWGIFFVYEVTVSHRVAQLREEIERLKQQLREG